jgi:hypothetical protein
MSSFLFSAQEIEMIRYVLIALMLFTIPAVAGDEPELTDREFLMPSRNIGCIVQDVSLEGGNGPSKRLHCVRNLPTTLAVMLDERGLESYPTEGDLPFSSEADVLQYGDNWYYEGFSCDSDQKGVLCSHNKYGAFRLSRRGLEQLQ